MKYKVVPFVAQIDPKKGTTQHIAEQLERLIDEHSVLGWEYVRLESVTTWVKQDKGCFGLGSKPGYTTSKQMVVFKA